MDYRNFEYKGKTHDLLFAYNFLAQGDWDRMISYLKQKLECSDEEAREIGNQIKDVWLEDRSKALQEAGPKKKKHGFVGKFLIFLFIIALAGGAYYWFGMRPQEYAIENEKTDVETECIGTIDFTEDVAAFEDFDLRGSYADDEGKDVLEWMDDSDAQYFYIEETDTEGLLDVFKTDPETFHKRLDEVQIGSLNKLNPTIAQWVQGIVGLNYEDFEVYGEKSYFDRCSYIDENEERAYTFAEECFGGEDPGDYYKDRELQLTCDQIKLKKVAVDSFERQFSENTMCDQLLFYGIYEATVTTNHCKGESIFPDEGETEEMTIEIIATFDEMNPSDPYIEYVLID